MTMAMDDKSLFLVVRLLAAIGGMVGEALLGVLVLALAIIFTDSTFDLENILPGAEIGAGLGLILGFCFPRVGKKLTELFASIG